MVVLCFEYPNSSVQSWVSLLPCQAALSLLPNQNSEYTEISLFFFLTNKNLDPLHQPLQISVPKHRGSLTRNHHPLICHLHQQILTSGPCNIRLLGLSLILSIRHYILCPIRNILNVIVPVITITDPSWRWVSNREKVKQRADRSCWSSSIKAAVLIFEMLTNVQPHVHTLITHWLPSDQAWAPKWGLS